MLYKVEVPREPCSLATSAPRSGVGSKGRTLGWEWRNLLDQAIDYSSKQPGYVSEGITPHEAKKKEVEVWRQDMRDRLDRKYGPHIGTRFNETRPDNLVGPPGLYQIVEHDARVDRLEQIMDEISKGTIHPDESF